MERVNDMSDKKVNVKVKRNVDLEGGCLILALIAAAAFSGLLLYVAVLGTVWLTRVVF